MRKIIKLPNEILGKIQEYIYLINLFNACTELYEIKKMVYYFKFNKNYSLQYHQDQRKFLEKINYISKQLSLNLSDTNITDVSALGNVHTLKLSSCHNLTDVSALGNVHTLNLYNCRITDVGALGNVHTLDLSDTNITDIRALKNVNNLILE
jgi:hypothetical protein